MELQSTHAHKTQHEIDWNGAQMKKMGVNIGREVRTIEATQIKTNRETMNLDSGQQPPSVWNLILSPP